MESNERERTTATPDSTHAGEFCLFVESLAEGAPHREATALPVLTVPASGIASLVAGEASEHGESPWRLRPCEAGDDAILHLESVVIDRRPALLMATPPEGRVRRNGGPVARLDVLAIGDELQLGASILHVSFLRRPRVGPPPTSLVGVPCAVCGLAVEPRSVVVVHDCGAPLHLEPQTESEPDPLQCALLGCPACEGPVALEAGYAFLPEL